MGLLSEPEGLSDLNCGNSPRASGIRCASSEGKLSGHSREPGGAATSRGKVWRNRAGGGLQAFEIRFSGSLRSCVAQLLHAIVIGGAAVLSRAAAEHSYIGTAGAGGTSHVVMWV